MVGGLECVLTVTDDHCSPSQESLVFVVVGSPHLISFAPPGMLGLSLFKDSISISPCLTVVNTRVIYFSYSGGRNKTHTTTTQHSS